MNTRTSSGSEILNTRIEIKHSWIHIICLLLLLLISYSRSESQIITIDVHKANDLLRNGDYRYLDVRTVEEFEKGHTDFDDALNIPYMLDTSKGRVKNTNFMEQVLLLCSKDDHLVVGCQSGIRSAYATTILLDAGLKHVYNMGGGYLAWVEKGLPVANKTPKVEL
ncbi:thiosulfate sulfurtransferase 18-like [Cynara cardunculus var. scolymus]|nr:thiosulfate sulfurtransferase 18-like [Cynara cardunculus var. scolymus]